uniref:Uncharacterized protein n=1 Tax=Anguilla anguilla TaxID=7936 RepID=A0A0E9PFZ2_ANGAN
MACNILLSYWYYEGLECLCPADCTMVKWAYSFRQKLMLKNWTWRSIALRG